MYASKEVIWPRSRIKPATHASVVMDHEMFSNFLSTTKVIPDRNVRFKGNLIIRFLARTGHWHFVLWFIVWALPLFRQNSWTKGNVWHISFLAWTFWVWTFFIYSESLTLWDLSSRLTLWVNSTVHWTTSHKGNEYKELSLHLSDSTCAVYPYHTIPPNLDWKNSISRHPSQNKV